MSSITLLTEDDFAAFFFYLNQQLSQNGKGDSPLFQPVSRQLSCFPKQKQSSFIEGLVIPVGGKKWRRAWVLRDLNEHIIGHVDLRGLPEGNTEHRALLGMGVLKEYHRKGLGAQLVSFVLEWAKASEILEYIDLSVLAENIPAIKLYEKAGFRLVGEIQDMFRIDGGSVAHKMMVKRLSEA